MRVVYTDPALDDLVAIVDYIAQDNPTAADRIKEQVFNATDLLANQPGLGRPGRVGRTRELIAPPYIVAYRVRDQAVEVLAMIDSRRSVVDIITQRLSDTDG